MGAGIRIQGTGSILELSLSLYPDHCFLSTEYKGGSLYETVSTGRIKADFAAELKGG